MINKMVYFKQIGHPFDKSIFNRSRLQWSSSLWYRNNKITTIFFFLLSNLCDFKYFYYKSHRPKTTWRSWKVCWTVVTTSLKSRYQILRGVLCCGPDIVDHCWISIKRFNNPDGPAQLLKTSQVSLIVWVAATCFLPFRQYIIVWPSPEYLENVMKPDKSISSWSLSN